MTQLPNNHGIEREILIKSSLLLLAIGLNSLEFFLPRIPFFPWLKPGLANIVTVVWIIRYSFVDVLLFILLRIWIVSFYFGFSFISFSLGFSGSLCACCTMALCWNILGKTNILGTIGIAIIGALSHNCAQLVTIYYLMAHNVHLFYQLPLMLVASVLFGGIVGILVPSVLTSLEALQYKKKPNTLSLPSTEVVVKIHLYYSLFLLLFCFMLIFINALRILLPLVGIMTLFVQYQTKGSIKTLFLPIQRFWLMFLFIGVLHAFFTYGIRIVSFLPISQEGVHQMVVQWAKLWIWLETSFLFVHYKFHTILFDFFHALFPRYQTTLMAGLLSAEYFPHLMDVIRSKSFHLLKMLVTQPNNLLNELFRSIIDLVFLHQK